MAICEKSGTATGYKYSNARNTCSDIDEQSELVNKIANKCKENGIYVEVDRSAKFTQSKFIPMTFGGMLEGMIVPVAEEYVDTNDYDTVKQRIIEDTIISVKKVNYNGYVYDLSVPETRNFVANGIIVHNCIYQWRGSDPSIILSIAPTFDMRTFVLSTNYRCKNEIVDYATNGIKFNSKRYDKDMQAFEKGGSVKILPSEKEDLCNLSILALNHIKWWIEQGEQLNDIAVLSRNNFHLALLSNMLLREGIYCNMTEDMKLTKSYMYRDIKNILEISQPCWKSDITASMLWKLCRFLGMSNAMIISKFQSASSLSLEDTLGYLIKHFIDKTIDFNKKLNISIQAEEKMGYYINRMSVDTINDIKVVYYSLTCGDRAQCVKTLMNQYYSASKFMYKSKDKDRSIFGLIQYINNLIIKDGFDKMLEFLRITEQFENGRMAVLGQKVTLTTVHSAKGREWKNVIMFACDNVSQPSFDGMYSMIEDGIDIHDIYTNIDEERRLFYVGNTRAKENLLAITYKMPSVFILEALGAFTDKTNNNGNIIEAVQDNTYLNRFDKFIEDKIFNPESKYYYNIEEHKTNKEK
jgi:DNA helicase-2/ATP-dependent DNA helicase PcrA